MAANSLRDLHLLWPPHFCEVRGPLHLGDPRGGAPPQRACRLCGAHVLPARNKRPAANGGNEDNCNIQVMVMTTSAHAPLTTNEEVTLRRVAYGRSRVRAMRQHDFTRLHELHLIKDSKVSAAAT